MWVPKLVMVMDWEKEMGLVRALALLLRWVQVLILVQMAMDSETGLGRADYLL